jgi:hypothetical protein
VQDYSNRFQYDRENDEDSDVLELLLIIIGIKVLEKKENKKKPAPFIHELSCLKIEVHA